MAWTYIESSLPETNVEITCAHCGCKTLQKGWVYNNSNETKEYLKQVRQLLPMSMYNPIIRFSKYMYLCENCSQTSHLRDLP
jgi:DNA-directed RNA polymerase subunit RPC12/RpoP